MLEAVVAVVFFALGFWISRLMLSGKYRELKVKMDSQTDTHEMLQNMQQVFAHSAKESMSEMLDQKMQKDKEHIHERAQELSKVVKPIDEKMRKLDEHIVSLEGKREEAYKQLTYQCKDMSDQFAQVFAKPNQKGVWGEISLRRVMELAGMTEKVDFLEQHATDRGKPDVIMKLPQERCLVVDCKTPVDAFYKVIEAEPSEREAALKQYIKTLKGRIQDLSKKSYWQDCTIRSPEFVVMYLPLEGLHSLALDAETDIFSEAAKKQIIIANPSSLLALAKTIAYVWQEHNLANNAREIQKISSSILSHLKIFSKEFEKLGSGLGKSMKAYNSSIEALNKTIVPHSTELQKLGGGSEGIAFMKRRAEFVAAEVHEPVVEKSQQQSLVQQLRMIDKKKG